MRIHTPALSGSSLGFQAMCYSVISETQGLPGTYLVGLICYRSQLGFNFFIILIREKQRKKKILYSKLWYYTAH